MLAAMLRPLCWGLGMRADTGSEPGQHLDMSGIHKIPSDPESSFTPESSTTPDNICGPANGK
ncbi:MAG: hypothetical protein ACLR0U_00870 [Enterocloster clostridioformis]